MKRAITNAIIFTVNEQDRIIRNGTVIIDGEKITAVGSSEEVKIPEDTDEILDCKGEMALLPGLIDTHNHSSLMRGVVGTREWLTGFRYMIWSIGHVWKRMLTMRQGFVTLNV